jgi:hypothetical protein
MASARSISLDKMVQAVEDVRVRLIRVASALSDARVAYAVVGGNAVAAWVSSVDPAAVRNTRDVDVLLRREDLPRAIEALEADGFVHRQVAGIDMFLDGPAGRARDAVHIVFAREKVRPGEMEANPDVDDSSEADRFRVISLAALVRIKLTAFRDKDRMHLRDLIDVGLVDDSWPSRLPNELARRLGLLLNDPNG